jgi:hypothetical protein
MTTIDVAAPAVQSKVRELLDTHKTMFLSTAANDRPWVAGTFFTDSDIFNLTLLLETTGRTLSNIKANPNVAIVISSGSAFAPFLQGEADALLLAGEDELEATKNALRTKAPEVEPLLQYPGAPVRLLIRRWRVTDVMMGWIPGKELTPSMTITAI